MLKSSAPAEVKEEDPLEHYAKHTAQIEVSFFFSITITLLQSFQNPIKQFPPIHSWVN